MSTGSVEYSLDWIRLRALLSPEETSPAPTPGICLFLSGWHRPGRLRLEDRSRGSSCLANPRDSRSASEDRKSRGLAGDRTRAPKEPASPSLVAPHRTNPPPPPIHSV